MKDKHILGNNQHGFTKEKLPDQYAYIPCWEDWLCVQEEGSR